MINFNKLEEIAYALVPRYRGDMRCFHVAAIYYKRRLVSIGYNQVKTHPKVRQLGYHTISGVHAELKACIRAGKEDYSGHEIAVLRIDRNDGLNESKPCVTCNSLIESLNFRNCFYTNSVGEWMKL